MDKLNVYNTLTKRQELFVPQRPPKVGVYLCGPTVYGPAHFGHARSAIHVDVVVRYLRYLQYDVCYVRNITDVGHLTGDTDDGEDKVVDKARTANISPMEVAQRYTNSYRQHMDRLNVLRPNIEPCATGHMIEQIAFTQKLLDKGFAYVVNGSVYFDLKAYQKKYPYGILSGRSSEEMRTARRNLAKTGDKKHPNDFALWKKADPNHLMQWSSPWGQGFPGWHIECTVMSQQYLGRSFDIYAGGIDLLFPHHDCSIAQAVGATGIQPAKYWLHNNLVMIDQQKMSKSANNFITLAACFTGAHPLLSRPYLPMVLRFFLLQAHYRNPIHFSNDALQAATKGYYKLINGLKILRKYTDCSWDDTVVDEKTANDIMQSCSGCYNAMNEDFNTAKTIGQLFALRKYVYLVDSGVLSLARIGQRAWTQLSKTYTTFLEQILGLKEEHAIETSALIDALLTQYAHAKSLKNYARIDDIRKALQAQQIVIQDSAQGFDWHYQI